MAALFTDDFDGGSIGTNWVSVGSVTNSPWQSKKSSWPRYNIDKIEVHDDIFNTRRFNVWYTDLGEIPETKPMWLQADVIKPIFTFPTPKKVKLYVTISHDALVNMSIPTLRDRLVYYLSHDRDDPKMFALALEAFFDKTNSLSKFAPGSAAGFSNDAGGWWWTAPEANPEDPAVAQLPALKVDVPCPCECDYSTSKTIRWSIIHLNDQHKWTREQVADWLETLDVDIRFSSRDPS
jgi:hypothetical protein